MWEQLSQHLSCKFPSVYVYILIRVEFTTNQEYFSSLIQIIDKLSKNFFKLNGVIENKGNNDNVLKA